MCGRIHSGKICRKAKGGRIYNKSEVYNKIIKSYDWQMKSKEIKGLDNYCCLVCKDIGVVSKGGLEVHHIVKINDDINLAFDNGNLISLCPLHHRDADFENISKDYLFSLIKKYRNDYEIDDVFIFL